MERIIDQQFTIAPKYHQALLDWQAKNFPDMALLNKYWAKHFPNESPFHLCAKTNPVKNDIILQGKYRGRAKFTQAREMRGSMLYQALRIIKAQCSTELGSIQQHVDTVDASHSDYARFSVLRIMAEELRHAYQMFWVLSHDGSWASTGDKRIADNLMDELLAMDTGSHVLDAFNINFTDALDNIAFACFIDRVGKFQLSMQEEFAYAPMSASMRPMLKEEAFHLKTGWEVLREISVSASLGQSQWTLADVQKKINLWYPRALEMFGNSEGGESNLQFSFKTISNAEAIQGYIKEVESLMQSLNASIIAAQHPDLSRTAIKERLLTESPLYLPSTRFLRIRAATDPLASQRVFDVSGKELALRDYTTYLQHVLPEKFLGTDFGKQYLAQFAC